MRLDELLAREGAPIEQAALEVARELRPSTAPDRDGCRRELDRLAEPLGERMPSSATPDEQARLLGEHVYGRLGFHGNRDDSYDPRNSYLDDVLARRTGIPITLAVVCMAIGRRAGIHVEGVGFPGHFLARVGSRDGVLIDPFDDGTVLGEADLHALAHRMLGDAGRLRAELLEPAGTASIVARMIVNLRIAHEHRGDHAHALLAADWLVTLTGAPEHRRARGLHALALGSYATAADDLEAFLDARPDAQDASQLRDAVRRARARQAGNLQ